jgi:hypothetical protein
MSDKNRPRETPTARPGGGRPGGGMGTLTRPAGPAAEPGQRRGRPAATPSAAPRVSPRPGKRPQATVQPPAARSSTARPSTARPQAPRRAAPRIAERGRERIAARAAQARAAHRMPFFVLLCGLLGGALVSALLINTTLAEGAFQITNLQQSNDALARQRQDLQEQVAAAQSAAVIEQRAYQLGMRPIGQPRYLDLKTGKIVTDAGSGAVSAIDVPGYTP